MQIQIEVSRSLSNSQAIAIALAVLEAKKRIYFADVTFFSKNDHWDYVEDWNYTWKSGDETGPCEICTGHGRNHGGKYTGSHLRASFPYLDILDNNTIQVNAHPNCRCALVRTTPIPVNYMDLD